MTQGGNAQSRLGGWLRRGGAQLAVVAVGVALGLGGIAFYNARTTDGPSNTPTATRFSFPTPANLPLVAAPTDDATATGPESEPVDAVAALTAFLQAEATGENAAAWALLDATGRRQWSTASAWSATRGERSPPVTFEVQAPAVPPGGDVDLAVDITRVPSLDPFRGLVAARSAEVWRVRSEYGRWRVVAKPVESRPVLVADATAPDAVRAWVDAMVACDGPGAARFQADANLLGPADVAASPCLQKGTWTVGSPVAVDRGGDVQPLLAAYGQGAAAWARLVPVEGVGRSFWAEVAPVGDAWKVVGVAAGG